MLSKHVKDAFLGYIADGRQQLIGYQPLFLVNFLEARYTLFHLEQILLKQRDTHTEETLALFLNARWQRIQHSDSQYLHDFTNPANKVCISIAQGLSKILKIPYMALIMPSLQEFPLSAYLSSSYAEELDLQEIVLSDCSQRLISIPDVLDYAQVDGVLKHNSLVKGESTILSKTEQTRFLSRHPTVQATYDAMQARVNFKLYGDTVGAALDRLIRSLREGGEHGYRGGESTDSGKDANAAIIEFNLYLESLDDETKSTLMNASVDDEFSSTTKLRSVASYWERLARPSHRPAPASPSDAAQPDTDQPPAPSSDPAQPDTAQPPDPSLLIDYAAGAVYCVEIIAGGLETILKTHPELYDLVSYHTEAGVSLATLETAVLQSGEAMRLGLPTVTRQDYYGDTGVNTISLHLLPALIKEPLFLLKPAEIASIADLHATTRRQLGTKKIADLSGELLIDLTRRYDTPGSIFTSALTKMTPEGAQRFIELTGFNASRSSSYQAGSETFFVSQPKRKRNIRRTDFAELDPKRNRTTAVDDADDHSVSDVDPHFASGYLT